jgi:CRISPR system Cascade subunit CasD
METLIFQLQGPLSSWGEAAVGEYRPSADYPSQSAILGLLAAAFGITRDDEAGQRALRASYRMAVGVLSPGRLLRDYHTVQVPSRADLKKRPQATRRDELAVPKSDLNTILSTRDYRQDAATVVALQAIDGAQYALASIADALRRPKFMLYLGRKSCPPAAPLHPLILDAASVSAAMTAYVQGLPPGAERSYGRPAPALTLKKIAWGDDFGVDDAALIGQSRHMSVLRKDQVLARDGWQFGDRREHIALLEE